MRMVCACVFVLFWFVLVGSVMAGGGLGLENGDVVGLQGGSVQIYSLDCVESCICTYVRTG